MVRVRKPIELRIAELDARRASLKARLEKSERTKDTRRKILLGAFLLHILDQDKDPAFSRRLREWLERDLPNFLTRDNDRQLFDILLAAPSTGIAADPPAQAICTAAATPDSAPQPSLANPP